MIKISFSFFLQILKAFSPNTSLTKFWALSSIQRSFILSVRFGFHSPSLLTFKTDRFDLRGLDLWKMTPFTHWLKISACKRNLVGNLGTALLRRGRQPEENSLRARTQLSPRFLYQSSLMEKRYFAMWMWLRCDGKLKVKIVIYAVAVCVSKTCVLKLPITHAKHGWKPKTPVLHINSAAYTRIAFLN